MTTRTVRIQREKREKQKQALQQALRDELVKQAIGAAEALESAIRAVSEGAEAWESLILIPLIQHSDALVNQLKAFRHARNIDIDKGRKP